MNRVFVFINGILNLPAQSDGWTDRAVTWTQTRTPHKAEKWEYATDAITRRFLQEERARKIATMLGYYEQAGQQVVLVGHSNGCDIIARVLALRGQEAWYFGKPIASAHLFAPAADAADFERALNDGDVERIQIFWSRSDRALQIARISRALLGWAGLGYGSLGLDPSPLLKLRGVSAVMWNGAGHSGWFKRGDRFEATMNLLHELEQSEVTTLS